MDYCPICPLQGLPAWGEHTHAHTSQPDAHAPGAIEGISVPQAVGEGYFTVAIAPEYWRTVRIGSTQAEREVLTRLRQAAAATSVWLWHRREAGGGWETTAVGEVQDFPRVHK